MKYKNAYPGRAVTSILGLAVFAVTVAIAQEEDQQEVFELSPFQVDASQDMGYVAANTLTGSRLRTNLSDVASSVSVFTEEFLKDTGLTSLEEIALYSVGSINDVQDINASPNINNHLGAANSLQRVRIRGIRATKGLDYFQALIPDDAYRAGRYDESRGPNGILFGISEAGGIINTSTLRASTVEDSGRIKYTTGTYEQNRLEGRFNKVLVEDVLGITLAGLTQDNGGWRDYQVDERERLYGAINWQPTKKLTLQAFGETGNHFGTRIRPYNASDRFLAWYLNRERFGVDAVTFVPGNGSTSLGDGTRDGDSASTSNETVLGVDENNVGRNHTGGDGTGRRYVYISNDGSFVNTAGLWESASFEDPDVASMEATLAATSVADIIAAGRERISYRDPAKIINYEQYGFDYPTHLNAGGPDMWREEDFETYTFVADYRITDNLYVNIAHNYQETEITAQFDDATRPEIFGDPNLSLRHEEVATDLGLDPDIPNPYAGRLYFESYWRYQVHTVEYDETRAAISYDLDFSDFDKSWMGRHMLAAGYAYREVSDQFVGYRYGFLGNPYDFPEPLDFDDNRNRIAIRTYLDEGDFSTYKIAPPPLEMSSIVTDDGQTRQIGWIPEDPGTINARSDIEVTSKILAMQNYFWNDRIVTTFGWREDEALNIAFGHALDSNYGWTLTEDPSAEGYRADDPIIAETKTAGIVFHLTDNFSLLANYATSIGLPEFRNIVFPDYGIADPVEGEGYDIGIGFNLLDDRISGRIVYFDTQAVNRTGSGGGTRIISDPMWQSMRAIGELRQDYPDVVRNPDTGQPYSDSEWADEVNALNGASGDGVSSTPAGRVNSFLMDELTNGWELSVTANITRNWRLVLNASYTDRIMANYGHQFARSAGYQKDETGRYIQAVTVNSARNEALTVDFDGVLTPGSIHQRILDIARAATGEIRLVDEDANNAVVGVKILDPNAETITINAAGTQWIGNGALIINTDSGDTYEELDDFNIDETVAYRLWESIDQLQLNIDENEKRWGLNPWKFNLFTTYDFKEGRLDGFSVGGGYRYLDGTIIGEDINGEEITSPSQSYFDLMLRYRQNLGKGRGTIEYQVNVSNLFDRTDPIPVRHAIINDPTSPLSRNLLIEPTTVRASITYSF